jgi:hypothetical protein
MATCCRSSLTAPPFDSKLLSRPAWQQTQQADTAAARISNPAGGAIRNRTYHRLRQRTARHNSPEHAALLVELAAGVVNPVLHGVHVVEAAGPPADQLPFEQA